MKKATIEAIVSILTTAENVPSEIMDELTAELNKGKERANAKMREYEDVKSIVLEAIPETSPATIAEIYEAIECALPEGFTKSKVQYGITHYWADEVVKHEGKVNSYTRKG